MLTISVWPRRLKEFLLTHPLYKSPRQFHHGTHGNARSGGTEAVGERDLRDPSTAPSNMRLRNLPCLSVYSVVKKAPPRRTTPQLRSPRTPCITNPHRLFGAYEVRITQ